jgi:queuine tRNA-ribosyltransferase
VGGSLGADKSQMYDVVAMTMRILNPSRPVHLLGIGGIADIFAGVEQGIDTFDCVHPTRLARHGGALLRKAMQANPEINREHINLNNASFREDWLPIDPECLCSTCQHYSRAYLHYLIKAGELLAMQAISIHNVFTMNRLLQDIRKGIRQQTLAEVRRYWLED